MEEFLYEELSYKIIKCSYNVYNALGYGYRERYYQNALAVEMRMAGLNFIPNKLVIVPYKGYNIGRRFVDFEVEERVILELKIGIRLVTNDYFQTKEYLKLTKHKLGLLILFSPRQVFVKRVVNIY